ncbi:hypothetical protein [Parafilimonas sp.]|uniref:hypothetical protein n=1 Tax=Parafilimonas sp. TaxID=1969739 RepID=UPI0039E68AFC
MNFKKTAAEAAISLIGSNTVIGLGDGSTMNYMVDGLRANQYNSLALFTSSFSTKKIIGSCLFCSE